MIGALVAGITGSGGASLSSYESIATASIGGVSSYTFSSIPSGFTHYQLRGLADDSVGYELRMRFNGDTSGNYTAHRLYGTGASVGASGNTGYTGIELGYLIGGGGNTYGVFIVDILDGVSATKNKTVRTFGSYDFNGSGTASVFSGLWINTAAITSITIYNAGSVNFRSGSTFALYGIKEA